MTFEQLGLNAPILNALREMGYHAPSPIQEKAIPPALAGRDVLGCAQTGTGKTCAFATPILQRLSAQTVSGHPIRALVLTPTRELAIQIGESFEAYGKYLSLRHAVIFGGVGQNPQVEALRRGVDILVATPGRLMDLHDQGFVSLDDLDIFVLDEADRMLDMGFIHDVKKILKWLPRQKQTLFFSATMPPEIGDLVNSLLHDPARVAVDPISSPVEAIEQSVYFVDKNNKTRLLAHLMGQLGVKNALVFTRTKHGANKVARDLEKAGVSAAAIHGNKSQTARQQALSDFKAGNIRCLVATDIAARGLDIEELSHVFNYNLPEVPETYVHRIGRTARAGADGTAVSFCAPEEKEYLAGIEKLNRRQIPVISGHPWDGVPAPVKAAPPVRGRKPKMEAVAEAPAPVEKPVKAAKAEKAPKAEKTAKAAKAVKAEPKAQKANATPKIEAKEEHLMDENQKRTPGGRNENRRSNNNRRREGGAAQAPSRGSNAQPKFDPHFVSAPETTPLRPAKKNLNQNQNAAPAAKPAAPVQSNNGPKSENNSRRDRNARGSRNERNDRGARPAQNQSGSQNEPRNAQPGSQPQANRRGSAFSAGQGAGRPARAPKAEPSRRGRVAAAKDEDPGLVLISRRPPQQKFTNFEEYMSAHGGATAPIEDHSEEV